jgi:hypothetical protein
MTRVKAAFLLSVLALATFGAGTAPKAATESDCTNSPLEAVMTLPSPVRKWGQISCTPAGHMVTSRGGWVWAWLEGAHTVRIPAQMTATNRDDDSYFTSIERRELSEDELANSLSIFHDGLDFEAAEVRGYRLDLTSVSGHSTTVYFFDLGSFAGGMWCPDGSCIPKSRFMIMHGAETAKEQPPSI